MQAFVKIKKNKNLMLEPEFESRFFRILAESSTNSSNYELPKAIESLNFSLSSPEHTCNLWQEILTRSREKLRDKNGFCLAYETYVFLKILIYIRDRSSFATSGTFVIDTGNPLLRFYESKFSNLDSSNLQHVDVLG